MYKHAKVTTRTPQQNGTVLIEKKSYYDELSSIDEKIEQSIMTNKATFIADLLACVSPISDGISKKVWIEIEADANSEPIRIVKIWQLRKQSYR